jgi:aerobic-type carbon monoxide dehydrogenase small subunit (CoxS/CutS family)
MIGLRINGKDVSVDATPDTPPLWVLRDSLADDRHQIRVRNRTVRCLHRSP